MSSIYSVQLTPEDFGTLAICAIRYCQGRQTYMPSMVQGICKRHLEEINDCDLGVMIEDCNFQRRYDLYGNETIDKPDWLKWEKALLDEKSRRAGNEAKCEAKTEANE